MTAVDLVGLYDLHIHSSPDLIPRRVDDIEAAQQAAEAGMSGILLKSHCTITADRATIAAKVIPGIDVYGSLTLNEAVGGLNVEAVQTALDLGAREIFLPTVSAANHRESQTQKGGISLLRDNLLPALKEIIDLVKQRNAILGTGHVSQDEIQLLIKIAADQGLGKIVITHPEHPIINLKITDQKYLTTQGVFFERCYASTFPQCGNIPLEQIVLSIKEVGASSTILTTDLGIAGLPLPVDGLQKYITKLLELGVSKEEITIMLKENPNRLIEK